MYKQIKTPKSTEIIINKSIFIGTSFLCFSEEEGRDKLSEIKKKYSDATHNCSAFYWDNKQMCGKFSDDGEPSGTAGKPILEVLKNKKLSFTGVVVTRYFGGIKLGAGGLVRAYTKSAADVLEASKISVFEMGVKKLVKVSYNFFEICERFFQEEKLEILNVEYLDEVSMTIVTKESVSEYYQNKIIDMTNGKGTVTEIERAYYAFDIQE